MVYVMHIITKTQKSTRDIQEIKRKETKHNTTKRYQHTREQSKKIGKEQKTTTKTFRKQ